jgi:hypothetical protein
VIFIQLRQWVEEVVQESAPKKLPSLEIIIIISVRMRKLHNTARKSAKKVFLPAPPPMNERQEAN